MDKKYNEKARGAKRTYFYINIIRNLSVMYRLNVSSSSIINVEQKRRAERKDLIILESIVSERPETVYISGRGRGGSSRLLPR